MIRIQELTLIIFGLFAVLILINEFKEAWKSNNTNKKETKRNVKKTTQNKRKGKQRKSKRPETNSPKNLEEVFGGRFFW